MIKLSLIQSLKISFLVGMSPTFVLTNVMLDHLNPVDQFW